MKKLIQRVSLLIVLLIPSTVLAGTITGNITENSLDKLMVLSGLNKQVAEYHGMVWAGFEQARQQAPGISDAELVEIRKSIEDAFQPSKILSTISIEIKNNISESKANDLLAWYESNLGKKITKAEEDASTPVAYQEMIRDAQLLLADEKRVKLVKKIDNLLNATDMTMQLQENTAIAIFTAISTAMNPGQPVNVNAFKAQLSAQEQQMRANAEQLVIVSYVYTYKDIEITSIEKYIQFLERSNTRKFNDSIIIGMKYALNQSINEMANSLVLVFNKYAEKVNK